jgi:hypothetical protein
MSSVLHPFPQRMALLVGEAVYVSGWSKRALFRAISDGRLRSYFSNGRRRIFPDDLERLVKGEPMPAGPPPKMKVVGVSGRGLPVA